MATSPSHGMQWRWLARVIWPRCVRGDAAAGDEGRPREAKSLPRLRRPLPEGVPIASAGAFPAAASEQAAVIYADAAGDSATAGYCAWTVVGDEFLFVEGRWTQEERQRLPICDLELFASTIGLVALQPLTGRRHVYSYTDISVAMAAMRGLVPSTAAMQWLTAERVSWMLGSGVMEATERVTSKANLWADMGSRARVSEMLAQAEHLGLRPRRVAEPAEWRRLLSEAAEAAAAEGGIDGLLVGRRHHLQKKHASVSVMQSPNFASCDGTVRNVLSTMQ